MQQELTYQPTAETPALVEKKTDVLSIINSAVASGADPDQLDKLLTLHERYEANEARKAFNAAMKACQEAMPVVVKNCENSHTRSRYANLEAVNKAIKPVYTRHGFSLSFGEGEPRMQQHILITCDCMHEAGHTQRYELNCPYDNTGAKGGNTKTDIQGMGSSVSYGRRYLEMMIFNVVVADEDDDGNAVAVTNLSPDQVATLQDHLAKLSAEEEQNFLNWIGFSKLADIPGKDYGKALSALQAKVRQKQR